MKFFAIPFAVSVAICASSANSQTFKTLLSFTGTGGAVSGASPEESLTLVGTSLYGTTCFGGASDRGLVFSVGVDGSHFRDLYDFTNGADGRYPEGDLTLSGGTLFGMTSDINNGPSNSGGYGTIFALTLPTPTPEPGTLGLVGAGAAALLASRWRRRRDCRKSKTGGQSICD